MEVAAKIWEATTENGEITITPIIEFLNNIKFLASAYNQMWVIKKMKLNDEDTIAFVDDVTGLKKMIIVNPDPLMQEAIEEIVRRGWFEVKEEYLLNAALGRSVLGYSDTVWNGIRQIVVYRGLLEKFRQNPDLKAQLLATHPHTLAECALQDKIWGIGMTMHDEYRFDPDLWPGQNLLGFTLMTVREELSKESLR